jgi:hypothetical protein
MSSPILHGFYSTTDAERTGSVILSTDHGNVEVTMITSDPLGVPYNFKDKQCVGHIENAKWLRVGKPSTVAPSFGYYSELAVRNGAKVFQCHNLNRETVKATHLFSRYKTDQEDDYVGIVTVQ